VAATCRQQESPLLTDLTDAVSAYRNGNPPTLTLTRLNDYQILENWAG